MTPSIRSFEITKSVHCVFTQDWTARNLYIASKERRWRYEETSERQWPRMITSNRATATNFIQLASNATEPTLSEFTLVPNSRGLICRYSLLRAQQRLISMSMSLRVTSALSSSRPSEFDVRVSDHRLTAPPPLSDPKGDGTCPFIQLFPYDDRGIHSLARQRDHPHWEGFRLSFRTTLEVAYTYTASNHFWSSALYGRQFSSSPVSTAFPTIGIINARTVTFVSFQLLWREMAEAREVLPSSYGVNLRSVMIIGYRSITSRVHIDAVPILRLKLDLLNEKKAGPWRHRAADGYARRRFYAV
ncbi:uncharacterized protein LACBIDRAFT_323904 [Laccaria bicolor S238N-H82]|uniref:Predicted protein n=1 Tax=Laccaria bicolor (strain S238N-H82 / ATCC MYA-4686) TaxID=486041 RepID=B0D007_LACBS|nr:uncharacterized protein LACBIDRAFT_323904 [Laccaria bicolor S238N-H82]EDR11376.1 predicted protein [Laccaria bicolor S238N-H82]|eukprot:XP_001877273.1 predicted protein [Laccaria bicolor S238N-H82]